jgi:hypothetical protein
LALSTKSLPLLKDFEYEDPQQLSDKRYAGAHVVGDSSSGLGEAWLSFLDKLLDMTHGKEWGWRVRPEMAMDDGWATRKRTYVVRGCIYYQPNPEHEAQVETVRQLWGSAAAETYRKFLESK